MNGPLRDVIDCHCDRCRRVTGHYMAATAARVVDVVVADPGSALTWWAATDEVAYGFCGRCGSTLFWRADDRPDVWSIAAGSVDKPSGLATTTAIFVDDAGDYFRRDETLEEHGGGIDHRVV